MDKISKAIKDWPKLKTRLAKFGLSPSDVTKKEDLVKKLEQLVTAGTAYRKKAIRLTLTDPVYTRLEREYEQASNAAQDAASEYYKSYEYIAKHDKVAERKVPLAEATKFLFALAGDIDIDRRYINNTRNAKKPKKRGDG